MCSIVFKSGGRDLGGYKRYAEEIHAYDPCIPEVVRDLRGCPLLKKIYVSLANQTVGEISCLITAIIQHPSLYSVELSSLDPYIPRLSDIMQCKRITKISIGSLWAGYQHLKLPQVTHIVELKICNYGGYDDVGKFVESNKGLETLALNATVSKSDLDAIGRSKSLRFIRLGSTRPDILLDVIWRTGMNAIDVSDKRLDLMSRNNEIIYHKHLPTYAFSVRLCDTTVSLCIP